MLAAVLRWMIDNWPIVVAAAILLAWAYFEPSRTVGKHSLDPDKRLVIETERRKTNFEIVGVALLVLGLVATYLQLQETRKQVELSEQTQVTDRLVKTIQQISAVPERQSEQIGGMYGLRALVVDQAARGDLSYFEVLDQTLSGFIRQHAPPWPCQQPCPRNDEPRPSSPVQVALSILGDKEKVLGAEQLDISRRNRIVDLRRVDLRGANLEDLYLTHIDFQHSNLSGADVTNTRLSNSDMRLVILDRMIGLESARRVSIDTKW